MKKGPVWVPFVRVGLVAATRRRRRWRATVRIATRRRATGGGRRRRAASAVALVVDAPRGRGARARLTLGRRVVVRGAAIARGVLAAVGVLARVRVRTDGLFTLLHDGEVVRTAVRRHVRVRLLHRLAAVARQLDDTT